MKEDHSGKTPWTLFDPKLPDHDKYPMNWGGRDVVWNLVEKDIAESRRYVIITGYASLEYLVEKLGGME